MLRLMWICLIATPAAFGAVSGPVGSDAAPAIDRGTSAAVVRIRCHLGDVMRFFRGAAIATGAPPGAADVVLTALHGLPEDTPSVARSCVVVGPDGLAVAVSEIWRPRLRGHVSTSDWAVVLTESPLGGPVQRLPVLPSAAADLGSRQAATGVPVRLPLLTAAAERDCAITALRRNTSTAGLFAHDCRAWPGHSGSPILAVAGGRLFIVGIHLGRHRDFLSGSVQGIGRSVDAAISAAIAAAATAGAAASDGARQRRRPDR